MKYRKLMWTLIVIAPLTLIIFLAIKLNPSFGGKAEGNRLLRMQQSPNYKDGKFQNPVETNVQTKDMPFFKVLNEFLFKNEGKVPEKPLPTLKYSEATDNSNKARITWLGHSTIILEIDGKRILTDPVFGKRISPYSFLGTKPFPYTNSYQLNDLPQIDLVLISHDHYDHLDYEVIKQLRNTQVTFVMPLGVGIHLEHWGIDASQINELDWWESYDFTDNLKFTATPARHFSGRGLNNRFSTLWASWVIESRSTAERIFFGADSGYFPGYKEIGEKFESFDLVMLECGQYSPYWPYIHMAPEETLQAAKGLNAKTLLPIHWAKYKLSIHPWKEPVERLLKAADTDVPEITTPQIGQSFVIGEAYPKTRWWAEL
ncbi:MBL fold metallo-hydrolase [Sunxiuqinia sp. A32]|uniref:MBL fold metallo-hydrolase n=1 Tax=Sunxiuqinia sp. A32 TaxID=3461496 RepID=UPI004045233B